MKVNIGKMLIWLSSVPNLSLSVTGEHSIVLFGSLSHQLLYKTRWTLLNIGSIRIYILTTGVVSNETNTYVRMYIEEFILVEIWIHYCTKLN